MPVTSSAADAHSKERTRLEKTELWQNAGSWWNSLPPDRRTKVMKAAEAMEALTLGDGGANFTHLNWAALPHYIAAGIVKVHRANQILRE